MPEVPFQKIASDICTFGNKDYLVIIDYFSKWLEILPLNSKTSYELIKKFKIVFSTHGVPQTLIADNMPYNSFEFKRFAREWRFNVVNSSPLYPRSNGMAESGVKIAKNILRKNSDLNLALLNYRSMPIQGIGLSPAQILMNRQIKTKLPMASNLLKLTECDRNLVKERIDKKQQLAKEYYDRTAKERNEFTENENIVIRKDKVWVPGKIVRKCSSPRSYIVKDNNNREYRRNSIHIKHSRNEPSIESTCNDDNFVKNVMDPDGESDRHVEKELTVPNEELRPKRVIRKPSRFKDYIM